MSIDSLKTEVKTAFDTLSNNVTVTPTDADSVMQAAAITRMSDVLSINTPVTNRYDGWNVSPIKGTDFCAFSIPYGMQSLNGKIYDVRKNDATGTVFQLFTSEDGLSWKPDFNFFYGYATHARVIEGVYYLFTDLGVVYKVNESLGTLEECSFSAYDMTKFGSVFVISNYGTGKLNTSTDLESWTVVAGSYGTPKGLEVVNSLLFITRETSTIAYTTPDLTTFTSRTLPYSTTSKLPLKNVNGNLVIPANATVKYMYTADGVSFSNSTDTSGINTVFSILYYVDKYIMSVDADSAHTIYRYSTTIGGSYSTAYLSSSDYTPSGEANYRGCVCVHNSKLVCSKDAYYTYVKSDTTHTTNINSYNNTGMSFGVSPLFDCDFEGTNYCVMKLPTGSSTTGYFIAVSDSLGYFNVIKQASTNGRLLLLNGTVSYQYIAYNKGSVFYGDSSSTTGYLYKTANFVAKTAVSVGSMQSNNKTNLVQKAVNGFVIPFHGTTAAAFVSLTGAYTGLTIESSQIGLHKSGMHSSNNSTTHLYTSFTGMSITPVFYDTAYAVVSSVAGSMVCADGLYGIGVYSNNSPKALYKGKTDVITTGAAIEKEHGICFGSNAMYYRSGDSFVAFPVHNSVVSTPQQFGGVIKVSDNKVFVSVAGSQYTASSGYVILENK
jgi:hypothetical protein